MVKIVFATLAVSFVATSVFADTCEMSGQPVEAVMVRGSAQGTIQRGETGYKISSREVCFGGEVYSSREVVSKPVTANLDSRSCMASVGSSSALSSGSGRGNGC